MEERILHYIPYWLKRGELDFVRNEVKDYTLTLSVVGVKEKGEIFNLTERLKPEEHTNTTVVIFFSHLFSDNFERIIVDEEQKEVFLQIFVDY